MRVSVNKKAIVLGTSAKSLINFRGELLKCFLSKGFSMTVASLKPDKESLCALNKLGVQYQIINLKRNGLNFIDDLRTFYDLLLLVKKNKTEFVLAYGIKLVVWGGIASRLTRTPFFAVITGLGYAFQGRSTNRRALTKFVSFLYRLSLKNSRAVIFQNSDNRDVFLKNGIVPRSKTYIVNGSGVDTKKFSIAELPKTDINFLCISRLLSEKGLREYAAAAKIVKNKFPNVEFNLLGPEDPSPDAISLEEISLWSDYINYKGSSNDVRPYIKKCHIFVLPSHHEGLPRSTLEAMSMGRPILTTNAAGCRDTVKEGLNGFQVSVGSIQELADRMLWFINNRKEISTMGVNSRRIVVSKFDVEKVNSEMLKIMSLID